MMNSARCFKPMRSLRPLLVGISACCLVLAGCATPGIIAPQASTKTTAEWNVGAYHVSFRAGPLDHTGPKSFSFYEISRTPPAEVLPGTIGAESALSIGLLEEAGASGPSGYIRTIVSRSGNTLLIEETLPVTTWPCSNWILVRYVEGTLRHDYLFLPQRQVRPTADTLENPKVTKVTDDEVSFGYSDGKEQTMPVRTLVKKGTRPNFPG